MPRSSHVARSRQRSPGALPAATWRRAASDRLTAGLYVAAVALACIWLCLAVGASAILVWGQAPRDVLSPALGALVTVLALLTWYVVLARMVLRIRRRRAAAADYGLCPVARVPAEQIVPGYVASVYLPRHMLDGRAADAVAASALQAASRAATSSRRVRWTGTAHTAVTHAATPLGICVYGDPLEGKTRLAWEVMRAALPGWTWLRWPQEPHQPFERGVDLASLRGQRIALWLDDMHEFATPAQAALLADLPRRCAAAGVRLVVVATCRSGSEETRAKRHLGDLIERLVIVRLAPISVTEAEQLGAALRKQGAVWHAADAQAAIASTAAPLSIGALALGTRTRRREVYPALPVAAQHVLQTLALLRSARIYSYPAGRVRAVAGQFFGLDVGAWDAACTTLARNGWLRVSRHRATAEQVLEPISGSYLDQCVPVHLTPHANRADEWPWLVANREHYGDVAALVRLGHAYSDAVAGGGALLPYDASISVMASVSCFRIALEALAAERRTAATDCVAPLLAEALVQLELGVALTASARLAGAGMRTDLWRQASGAFRATLDRCDAVAALLGSPAPVAAYAALARLLLAETAHQRAGDALYIGDPQSAAAHLLSAERLLQMAAPHYTAHDAPARHRQVEALRTAVQTTLQDLGMPELVDED